MSAASLSSPGSRIASSTAAAARKSSHEACPRDPAQIRYRSSVGLASSTRATAGAFRRQPNSTVRAGATAASVGVPLVDTKTTSRPATTSGGYSVGSGPRSIPGAL
jgi:hypothetical protein